MSIHLSKCFEKTVKAKSLKKLINQSSSMNLTSAVLKQIEVVELTISYSTDNFMMKQISQENENCVMQDSFLNKINTASTDDQVSHLLILINSSLLISR